MIILQGQISITCLELSLATMKPYDLFLAHLFKDLDPGEYPFRLSVETTNHCNLRCVYCPREDSGRGVGHMSWDLFQKIADESAGEECIFYPQGFGEAFMHPQIKEMLLYLNQHGVRCTDIITNATYLTDENCHAIMDASVPIITVSLDGADPAVFEALRVNASYDDVVANVERLFRLREERGATFPHIVLSVVGAPEVLPSVDAFRDFWASRLRENDQVFVCTPISWAGTHQVSGAASREESEQRHRGPCRMLYKTLQVYYDGRATPCCYDHRCELEVGNVQNSSIKDIWNGEKLRQLRTLHEAGRFDEIELCRNCPDFME